MKRYSNFIYYDTKTVCCDTCNILCFPQKIMSHIVHLPMRQVAISMRCIVAIFYKRVMYKMVQRNC